MPPTSQGGSFDQIHPGAPTEALQCVTTFVFRHKRYFAYISGHQLSFLAGPTDFVQALSFEHELHAVLADGPTGKVALIAGASTTYVLQPVTEGWNKVWWEKKLCLDSVDAQDQVRCLSWGTDGEILVGGSRQLSLYSTSPASRTATPQASNSDGDVMYGRRPLWSKAVASPVRRVGLSPGGGLIATSGDCDRLVKIWRCLSFEEALFDYCYLTHGGVVTHLEWRPMSQHTEERRGSGISGRHDEELEVLYTISSDGIVRVWRAGGLHDLEIVALQTSIDLVGAIPQSPSLSSKKGLVKPTRYACILASDSFSHAVTASIGRQLGSSQVSHSLEHLKEVITQSPDVILALDGQGRMSAWGLQSIGHKRRADHTDTSMPFHIAHTEGLGLRLMEPNNATFTSWFDDDEFNLLVHDFSGTISWWQGQTEVLFSPSAAGDDRLKCVTTWSGGKERLNDIQLGHDHSKLVIRGLSGALTTWDISEDGLQLEGLSESVQPPAWENQDSTAEVRTTIAHPSVVASDQELIAMISSDGEKLTVVERRDGHVEHEQRLSVKAKQLALLSTSPLHSFLAVGYGFRVTIFVRSRYEHGIDDDNTWTPIKTVSVEGIGLHISSIAWIPDGRLVLVLGNGMLLANNKLVLADLPPNLREVLDVDEGEGHPMTITSSASVLRKHLPPWHPAFLHSLVAHGRIHLAVSLLHKLLANLKFWSEGDELHVFDDSDVEALLSESQAHNIPSFSQDLVNELHEQLIKKDLPMLSTAEQVSLQKAIETIGYICAHARGLDIFAVQYLFNWKFQTLHATAQLTPSVDGKVNGVHDSGPLPSSVSVPQMHWKDIAFAYHSKTQQALLDILILHYDNKITWPTARALGLTAWIADREALATVFEALAQSAYRASDPPEPINASLFFLALHKKTTLLGLWRIATWHKEQRATVNFLKRDFEKSDAKTAAKKNAYALMGKRRFEYAAAFFLLADDPASAIGVLATQCEDIMLAVAVARLYGEGIARLVDDRLLPQAVKSGDRWYTTWCHTIVARPQEATSSLIKPLDGVVMWWQDDPLTLRLYQHLRGTHPSTVEEYHAVSRAARVLHRMGLSLMALDLVRNWKFAHASQPTVSTTMRDQSATGARDNGVSFEVPDVGKLSMLDDFTSSSPPESTQPEPPSMLDSFAASTPVVDEKAAREAKAAELLAKLRAKKSVSNDQQGVKEEKEKRAPTQFKEPDVNSLLDSFGL